MGATDKRGLAPLDVFLCYRAMQRLLYVKQRHCLSVGHDLADISYAERNVCCNNCLLLLLQQGDKLPDATVYEGKPDHAVKIRDVFKGKKGVLFGVPGTP